MTTNTQKPIKGRTIMTRLKNDESLTLEMLAEEYGWELEKFCELVKKAVGGVTFAEILKADEKKKKKKTNKKVKDIMEGDHMKARIKVQDNEKKNFSEAIKDKLSAKSITGIEDDAIKKEDIASKTTLEELQKLKSVLDMKIKSEESKIESKKLFIQKTVEETKRLETNIASLKEKIAAAETELFNNNCEIEKNNLEISAIQDTINRYNKERDDVISKIKNLTVVYCVAPTYNASALPAGVRLVSNVPKEIKGIKAEVIEMPKIKLPFTPEEIEDFGYDSNAKFREDYNFVLLVKKLQVEGSKVKVLTKKGRTVNNLLDHCFGKGNW